MATSLWRGEAEEELRGERVGEGMTTMTTAATTGSHVLMSSALQLVASAVNTDEDDALPTSTTNDELDTHTTDTNSVGTRALTIVASDNEVANGFVKDGKRLPYVFETTDAGARRRSSKILPVCGVCGKRFVCVTTMKRHLVTHTGEKPFSCKVCGKQYTQKGNLRVHERTHRNDRPFECNICHQKFYRKEPMQKHQWRQHGIVHFKSRQITSATPMSTPSTPSKTTNVPEVAKALVTPNVLYNSLVEQIKQKSMESMVQTDSRHLNGNVVLTKEDVVADKQLGLVTSATSSLPTSTTCRPIKLKKLLAKAYEREVESALHSEVNIELVGSGETSQPLDLSKSHSASSSSTTTDSLSKRVRIVEHLPNPTAVTPTFNKPSSYLTLSMASSPSQLQAEKTLMATGPSKTALPTPHTSTSPTTLRLMTPTRDWNAERGHNARTV